jgi:solute carrier family 25 carnitine/acylcarnitine transporter 20/29
MSCQPLATTTWTHDIIGATGAACASTLVGHPLDTIKVHLQTNSNLNGSLEALKHLLHQETSSFVLFRGMAPPLMNAIVMNTVMFSVFYEMKQTLGPLGAGLVSGIVTACLSTPTDFVKIQSQLRGVSSMSVVKGILFKNPTILFRGHVSNLAREGVFTMVYLGLYDVLRHGRTQDLVQVAATSSLTGGLAWIASYPFDTIKTVIQGSSSQQQVSYHKAIQKNWNENGGIRAFYKGCGTSTGRAVMVTSIRMIVYEWILGLF